MAGIIWLAAIISSIILIALSSLILYVYLKGLRFIFSRLSLGLTLFAFFLLIQGIVSLYNFINLANQFGPEVGLPAFLIITIEVIALSSLFWATWE